MAARSGDEERLAAVLRSEIEAGRSESQEAQAAFGALFDAFYPRLVARAQAKRIAASEADDLAQETLLGVWQGLLRTQGQIGDFPRYLWKIFDHRVADYWDQRHGERRGRTQPLLTATSLYDEQGSLIHDPPAPGDDPAAAAERSDWRQHTLERISAEIAALPDEFTREVVWRFINGSTMETIAHELDVGLGKVRYRIEQAMPRLRKALSDLTTD